jgi:hypothetical protein
LAGATSARPSATRLARWATIWRLCRGFSKARTDPGVDAAHAGVCATTARCDQELAATRLVHADRPAQGATFLARLQGCLGCGVLLARGEGLIAVVQASLETLGLVRRRGFVSTRYQHSAHQQKQRNSKCHGHPLVEMELTCICPARPEAKHSAGIFMLAPGLGTSYTNARAWRRRRASSQRAGPGGKGRAAGRLRRGAPAR